LAGRDALYEELLVATTLEAALEVLVAINDLIIGEVVCIPTVPRPLDNTVSNRPRKENLGNDNGFASPYWNIGNWNLAEDAGWPGLELAPLERFS